MHDKVTKSLTYRKAAFLHNGEQTLQQMLQTVLSSHGRCVQDRIRPLENEEGKIGLDHRLGQSSQTIREPSKTSEPSQSVTRQESQTHAPSGRNDDQGRKIHLLTDYQEIGGILCGVFVTYTEGQDQLVLALNPGEERVNLDRMTPPKNTEGKKTEFLRGTLFFGIYGNNVILTQSKELRANSLADYFTFLLKPLFAQISVDEHNAVFLREPSSPMSHLIKDVKAIRLGVSDYEYREIMQEHDISSKVRSFDSMSSMQIIIDLFRRDNQNRYVEISSDDNLKAEFILKTGRKTSSHGQQIMDSVAMALKGLDEDYKIELRNGTILTKNNLKISKAVKVGAVGGHPKLTEIYSEISAWLRELIEDGIAT